MYASQIMEEKQTETEEIHWHGTDFLIFYIYMCVCVDMYLCIYQFFDHLTKFTAYTNYNYKINKAG